MCKVLVGILNEVDHLEDLDIDGNVSLIVESIFKNAWKVMGWIHLAEDGGRWRAAKKVPKRHFP